MTMWLFHVHNHWKTWLASNKTRVLFHTKIQPQFTILQAHDKSNLRLCTTLYRNGPQYSKSPWKRLLKTVMSVIHNFGLWLFNILDSLSVFSMGGILSIIGLVGIGIRRWIHSSHTAQLHIIVYHHITGLLFCFPLKNHSAVGIAEDCSLWENVGDLRHLYGNRQVRRNEIKFGQS